MAQPASYLKRYRYIIINNLLLASSLLEDYYLSVNQLEKNPKAQEASDYRNNIFKRYTCTKQI